MRLYILQKAIPLWSLPVNRRWAILHKALPAPSLSQILQGDSGPYRSLLRTLAFEWSRPLTRRELLNPYVFEPSQGDAPYLRQIWAHERHRLATVIAWNLIAWNLIESHGKSSWNPASCILFASGAKHPEVFASKYEPSKSKSGDSKHYRSLYSRIVRGSRSKDL